MRAYLSAHRQGLLLAAGFALAFVGLAVEPRATRALPAPAQDNPPPTEEERLRELRSLPGYGTADSNHAMIAVTGLDLTGSSILFLVDTQNRQLAVYQANGGSDSTQSVRLVGARRIDLDLQLYGFNDKSEFSFEDLERKFAENQRKASNPK